MSTPTPSTPAESTSDSRPPASMTLREQRILHTRLLAEWLGWFREEVQPLHPGWEIALDEGMVHSPRACRTPGGRMIYRDGVHRLRSRHHDGCANDALLYVDGEYVERGDHPAWVLLAGRWEAQHPWARSGRRWGDANHLSIIAPDGRM